MDIYTFSHCRRFESGDTSAGIYLASAGKADAFFNSNHGRDIPRLHGHAMFIHIPFVCDEYVYEFLHLTRLCPIL